MSTDPGAQVVQRLCDDNAEDGVRATTFLVHVGGSNSPRLVALRHQHLNVLQETEADLKTDLRTYRQTDSHLVIRNGI